MAMSDPSTVQSGSAASPAAAGSPAEGTPAPSSLKVSEEVRRKYPNLERVLNLELPVIVVLAEKNATLEEILALNEGSVIVFKKHNSQPLDIRINNRKVGAGKTIKIGEHFGIHIREVGTPREILATIR
jgi:flagellar motor switch protein FliN